MRKTVLFFSWLFVLAGFLTWGGSRILGVSRVPTQSITPAITSSPSGEMTPTETVKPSEVKDNLTEPSSKETTYRLENVLEGQKVGSWNGFNSLRLVERMAIARGVPASTIVLLLLLPLIATVVSVLHYVVGLSGYGIFLPTLISVTFLATGILGGLVLFALILAISIVSNLLLKKFKLHFWPARAINLIFISLGTALLMFFSSFTWVNITQISIFPILMMVMLAEEFTRTQLAKSKSEAKKLTIGTLILAIAGAVVMNFRWIQETVLLYPEWTILLVIVINVLVGNYSGIRLSEISRFKNAIRNK